MEPNYIKPNILYDLFFTRSISNVTLPKKQQPEIITKPLTPIKSKKRRLEEYSLPELEKLLSPNGKKILKTVPQDQQLDLAKDLIVDTKLIESKEIEEYKDDPDYIEKMENNGLGFYMENFISYYGVCPVCKLKTLRKYSFSNMPVVDLICINDTYHTVHGGCFLFQVKTSLNDLYFSKKDNYITVGSINYGYNSHIVKGSDNINNKKLVIGYICLYLNPKSNTEYKINKQKSFVLLPNLNNQSNESYYSYNTNKQTYMGKNEISWNKNLVDIMDVNTCLSNIENVNTNVIFEEIDIKNPYIAFSSNILSKGNIHGGKRYKLVY